MKPVMGLDVAKEESQVQAYLRRRHPYKKSFKFKHNTEGLERFYAFFQEVDQVCGECPMVILELTGHYHEPVIDKNTYEALNNGIS